MVKGDPLWDKLMRFELAELGGSLTFADRLAAENGWSTSFTLRVIGEYRRFLYLAARAGHKVTPSTVIDEAWHLHLLYTESYWNDLCATVLERPLHHGPTKGGNAEEEKFRSWYQRTLSSYRRIFGEEAPTDIWPNGRSMRSGQLKRYRLIDGESYFVLPRPKLRHLSRAALLGVVGVAFAGARREAALVEIEDLIIWFFIAVVVGIILVSAMTARKRNGDHHSSGSCSGGCGSGTTFHSSGSDYGGEDGDGGDSGGDSGGGDGGGCGGGCGGGGD